MALHRLLADVMSDAADRLRRNECGMTDVQMERALSHMLYVLSGERHYDESTAREAMSQMYYFSSETKKEYAPFISVEDTKEMYEEVRTLIPDYTLWDFVVTANLVYSNHIGVLKAARRSPQNVRKRVISLSLSFLLDEDTKHPTDKIWWYMNS